MGEGVCHQLIPEKGHVVAGDLMVGCDCHTCTYGAINVFSTGVGSTDGAAAMAAGKLWFKVPDTMKVAYNGTLQPGVFSKDLILYLAGQIGADGATYEAIEFTGPVIDELSVEARMTISNMAIEVGAKAGLMNADAKTIEWFDGRGEQRPGAVRTPTPTRSTDRELEFDASDDRPAGRQAALRSTTCRPIEEVEGTPIAEGVLGHLHERAPRGPRHRREHPEGPQGPPRRALHRRAGVAADPARRDRGRLHPDARRGRRRAGHAGLRSVRRHPQRRAERRRERHLDRQPQLQGPHGQQQRVHLPRQPGHRGRRR